tara:strand:+ start:363 stop:1199 length:837 start_codon:yes stop_codon:yes gene_type:complete
MPNSWHTHLRKYSAAHPGLSASQCAKQASATYTKKTLYRGRFTNMHERLVSEIIQHCEKKKGADAIKALREYCKRMLNFSWTLEGFMRSVGNVVTQPSQLFQRSLPFKIMITLFGLSLVARQHLSHADFAEWYIFVSRKAAKLNRDMGMLKVAALFALNAHKMSLAGRHTAVMAAAGPLVYDALHKEFGIINGIEREKFMKVFKVHLITSSVILHLFAGGASTYLRRLIDKSDYDKLVAEFLNLGKPEGKHVRMPSTLLHEVPYKDLERTLANMMRSE